MDWNDVHVTAEQLLLNWVTAYLASFERSHEWPAPVRAARLIRSTFRSAWDIEQLARRVGCSRTHLIRSFKEAYGMSLGAYHTRCRTRSAVAMLRRPGSNVGAVGFEVGYHSAKNFYRARRGLTGLTPSEIRHLSGSEAAAMLATLDLPAPTLLRRRARIVG
jgi:AraC-like DNA-binding protein